MFLHSSSHNNNNNVIPEEDNIILPESAVNRDWATNDEITQIGTFTSKVISVDKRKVQNEYYVSEAYKKYHDEYDFVYPSQKRNYRQNGNNIFRSKTTGKEIDGFGIVLNERVIDENGNYVVHDTGAKIKYSDPDWIESEIKKGTFKKHIAADDMYLNDISQIDSITKEFTVPTTFKGELGLGIYAPPGEIVEITFDDQSWELIKHYTWNSNNPRKLDVVNFSINQSLWDNWDQSPNGRISNRYPYVLSSFAVDRDNKTLKIGSPFGGPISICINRPVTKEETSYNPKIEDIKFTVKGAIPCMFYQDGFTTEKEWKNQIELVKKQQLAPALQACSSYISLAIPFTGLNEVGHFSIDALIYPKDNFKKWNDFIFLSNLFAGRDIDKSLWRLNMRFCDDILKGGAWGGAMKVQCRTNVGVNSFFIEDPIKIFNAYSSWEMFHEINHNYQQDNALFSKRGHGETNQVTAFCLSIISDITRFRNEINYTGEEWTSNWEDSWAYLDTPFSIIKKLNHLHSIGWNVNEYPIYSLLLFFMGPKNFVNYIRSDVRNHPADAPDWTGIKEIGRISDTFKLDLWPTFEIYGNRFWSDWASNYNAATQEEKGIIDRLKKDYKSVDLIACQYSSGSYLWNQDKGDFVYTGDSLPAFEIPAFDDYRFDFENMIISVNDRFNWSNLEFPQTSKLGANLRLDPTNSKRLIYTPNADKVSEVDEFDIFITPGTWEGKPNNYIHKYKFKIKVRQIVNLPVVETYNPLTSGNNEAKFQELRNAKYVYRTTIGSFRNTLFPENEVRGVKYKFKFVAPSDGTYEFRSKWDDMIELDVDGKNVFKQHTWTQNFNTVYKVDMKKGESKDFEYFVINNGGPGSLDIQVLLNDQGINLFENILIPGIENKINDPLIDVVKNKNYQFKTRKIDRNTFNHSLTSSINLSTYEHQRIEPNQYTLSSSYSNVQNLNNYYGYFELWNHDHGPNQSAMNFTVDFNEITEVKSLIFGHRTNNHYYARPSHITVKGFRDVGDTEGSVMFDGQYGSQFYDRGQDTSVLNLSQPGKVKSMKIEMYNAYSNGIILQWFRPSSTRCDGFGPSYGFNNPLIKVDKNWIFRKNDDDNTSAINNLYVMSQKENSSIEFTLSNTYGFAIVGQLGPNVSDFDIYIDGVLQQNVSTASETKVLNASLYDYHFDQPKLFTVKIVARKSEPLYLNYIMTFGTEVYLK